jgi:hypothetical protein
MPINLLAVALVQIIKAKLAVVQEAQEVLLVVVEVLLLPLKGQLKRSALIVMKQ